MLTPLRCGSACKPPKRISKSKLREVDGELQNAAREWDKSLESSDPGQREAAKAKLNELLNRRSYIRNLVINVQKELL